jgi:hypothetical protein
MVEDLTFIRPGGMPSGTGGGMRCVVASHRLSTYATREALRHYWAAIHGIAVVFPDAPLAID